MQSTIPEIIEDHLEEDLDDFDPPFSPQSPEETITTSNSKPNLSISTNKPPPTSATMARHLLEGGAGRKKSKLEVSRSSSNFDTNLTTPLSTMVEHSFIPNPVAVQQAAEELEEKQKRKISGGTPVLGQATLTPFPTDNIIITPTPNVNIAIPITPSVQVLPHSEDTFTSNLEDLHYEDDASMLEQIKAKEACFAEEYISEEIVQVCRDLYKVLDMRRKHQVGEYTDDEKKEYRPWNCFYSKDDFIGIVDEDDLLLHSRGQQNVGSTIHAPFDPNDIEACKRIPSTNEDLIECRKGVFFVKNAAGREFVPPVSFEEHFRDYRFLSNIMYDAPTKSFCYTRLTALELKFTLFKKLKQFEEVKTQKMVPHRDWYNVRKVDGHLHLSSMANQKHLLRFIKTKLKQCPDEVVIVRDGKKLTLSEVFKSLHMTPYDLSVDTLDVHVDKSQTMHRFDKFNLKYSPFGQSRLREIFLKTDNLIEGKYFAEMNKEVFRDLEDSRYQHAEPRVSIYGKQKDEWTTLANWICKFKMFSTNIRWLIQIPRLYNIHKEFQSITNFEQMLKNIFEPLFEATRSPEKYPELSTFLGIIVGFDSVDDESKPEPRFHLDLPSPDEWTNDENPPYAYYTYYFYANLKVLNAYRKSKGMNTFAIRPHAGEAGSASHLVSAYLLSDEINHGIELRKAPVLQYLYYLSQIGLAMSPLSNNSLFLSYEKNPFPQFFQRGLNVTLSTDDPLMFHFTREPLMEEYSIAAQVYHLSNVDLCEIARNSVIQSGFEDVYKKYWLGTTRLFGRNDIRQSNVPNLRLKYRFETLFDEHLFIQKALAVDYLKKKVKGVKYAVPPPMPPTEVLAHLLRDKPSYLALSFGSMGSLNNYPALTMTTPKNTEPPVSEASVIATKAKEERAKQSVEGGAYNIWILSAAILIGSFIIGHSLKK